MDANRYMSFAYCTLLLGIFATVISLIDSSLRGAVRKSGSQTQIAPRAKCGLMK